MNARDTEANIKKASAVEHATLAALEFVVKGQIPGVAGLPTDVVQLAA